MSKHHLLPALFIVIVASTTVRAQSLCPAGAQSDKLLCTVPQIFGTNGLPLVGGPFQNSFLGSSLRPLNSAIARQAVFLPLASPSSGITFTWDSAAKVPVASAGSLGPVLGERAETIGKYKLFVSFDYQYLNFSSIDGTSLKSLPEVFTQPDDSVHGPPGETCSINTDFNTGQCAFIRDIVRVQSRLDLKIHEFITFFTFGVTNRIDVSLAMPIRNVRLGLTANANIVDISATGAFAFANRPGCGTATTNCLNQQFSIFRTASGIGDMTMRVKGTAWKGERAALALGADIRLPTGDATNFLGAGAAGFQPFIAWSLSSRISPHALAGFEVNGSSVVAGDVLQGTKDRLPGQFRYSAGADILVTKWLTGAFDLVGQELFQTQRITQTSFTELAQCTPNTVDPNNPSCPSGPGNVGNVDPNLSQSTGTFNVTSLSIGAKVRPFSNLILTGNAMIKMNNGGLRSNIVPLVGVSYTF